ncbi:uncharacterized protein LOC111242490 [Vigna radiata var. radiata]|uniref:Uncharacterized protein LOC111242490 n=1 Tax=Vigna radiata var. radiata TaxID=3916 RepID=A0A3Q0FH97_VIGRR|nr:uncharacterized protein LOC111242490 [Vigna radiata var. radiata]
MVVAIPLGFNGTLYQSAKRCDFKSVAEMLTLKKTVSNKGSMEKGEGCSNWRDLSSDDENYEADHSENDSNSFETPTPTRRGKKIRGTFSHVSLDGVPKEGLRIQDILLRIALLTMISDKALDLKEEEAKAIFEELISRESMDEHNSY